MNNSQEKVHIHLQVFQRKIGKDINGTTELIVLQVPVRETKNEIAVTKKT